MSQLYRPTRRAMLAGTAALGFAPLLACAPRPQDAMVTTAKYDGATPVVFVHGNGDTAALWHTTFWRWESNGFPASRLFAIDFPYPLSRTNDDEYQAGRSSSRDQFEQLSAAIAQALDETKAGRVALVGSSRGGNAIRNYLKNGPGAAYVSHAVLCGTPNHGVIASTSQLVGSEFNGSSNFLRQLNAGSEIVPGVAWMTTRSDGLDKFAQPDGAALGMPGTATGITAEGPALAGAKNIVLPGLDHREVAFHEKAFAATWEFIIGSAPATTAIKPEAAPVLNGKVNGMVRGVPTNLPVEGAQVEIYETNPQTGARLRQVHARVTGVDGYWGPFTASPTATYEFVLSVTGQTKTHIYRSPFPRSSSQVHLRTAVVADRDRQAGSIITISRPRGYFGQGRGDIVTFDGQPGAGIPPGIPVNATSTLTLPRGTPQRSVVCRFNTTETIVVQSWDASDDRAVIAELHY